MTRFGDQHVAIHPDDAARLAKDDLDDPGVLAVLHSPLRGHRRRGHRVEPHHRAFRLRDDLLRDDEDVPGVDAQTRAPHRSGDQLREVGVTCHLGNAVHGEDVQIH